MRAFLAAHGARLGKAGAGRLGSFGAGKAGGGKLALLASKSKVLLLILLFPLTPIVLVIAAVFGLRGRKKPVKRKRSVERRRMSMRRLIASRAVMVFLAALSVAVAGAGLYIVYKHLRTNHITVAAGSPKGESYILMQAVKTVVERHYPSVKIAIHETGGTTDNFQRLERGDAQLATVQADVLASPKATGVAVLYDDMFQLLVHKDQAGAAVPVQTNKTGDVPAAKPSSGPITQFADLGGKRIALARRGGQFQSFLLVAAHFGLKEKDFTFIGGDDESALEAFARNDADASFQVRSIQNPAIEKLVRGDAMLIPIADASALHTESRGDVAAVIPKGTYQGNPPLPPVDINTIASQRLLMARNDADSDAIYIITKVLMENRREISNAIPDAQQSIRVLVADVAQPLTRAGLAPPVHPGALAYYDHDRKPFLAEQADMLGFLVAGFVLSWLWIAEIRRTVGERKKSHGDNFNRRLVALMSEAREATSEEALLPIEGELSTMMLTAIDDLNKDHLSELSFQSFHTIWQVAIDTVRQRKVAFAPVAAPPVITTSPGASTEGKQRWSFSNLLSH